MSSEPVNEPARGQSARARGRGKSRGGLGKYLRARGRRGSGRPAEFGTRLVLDDEQEEDLEPEQAAELRAKYSKRILESNVDRYKEKPTSDDNNTEGVSNEQPEEEPEIDISALLERQRLDDRPANSFARNVEDDDDDIDDDDVDHSLSHLSGGKYNSRKGKMQQISWDPAMQDLQKEKEAAEAVRDLKSRFRGEAQGPGSRYAKGVLLADPSLEASKPPKGSKQELEQFLDDLLD